MLSVYKPRGMTPYGRRKQHEQRTVPVPCRCSDSCSASTERTEPVKLGDTIVEAMGAQGGMTAVSAPATSGIIPNRAAIARLVGAVLAE